MCESSTKDIIQALRHFIVQSHLVTCTHLPLFIVGLNQGAGSVSPRADGSWMSFADVDALQDTGWPWL